MGIGDGWAIDQEVFDAICRLVPVNGVLLEFGSGSGTFAIAKTGRSVYAVEHDVAWVGKYPLIEYIYAPIVNGWYDADVVRKNLPVKYDCVLIDGPPKRYGRHGIMSHLDLLSDVPVILDDMQRNSECLLGAALSEVLCRPLIPSPITATGKMFGIIL